MSRRRCCKRDLKADDLYVCGDIYAQDSTLMIANIVSGSNVPVSACNLAVSKLTSCKPDQSIDVTGDISISGTLTVPSGVTALNYNLTNVNADLSGNSILGPLTGPGGYIRSFKTLTSNNGSLLITSTGTSLNIETVGGGTVTSGANEGSGFGVFDPTTSTTTTLKFRTLTSTDGSVSITNGGTTLDLSAGTVKSGVNEGSGFGVFNATDSTASTLFFRTLTSSNGSITISNTGPTLNLVTTNNGTVTAGANEGSGVAIFDPTTSTANILRYRTLTSTGGTVTITNNGTTLDLEAVTPSVANVGNGSAGIYRDTTAGTINLRSLKSLNPDLTIVVDPDNNEIDFNYTITNQIANFLYAGNTIPPYTWTNLQTPIQNQGDPSQWTITGDSLTGTATNSFLRLRVFFTNPSLVAAGIQTICFRILNNFNANIRTYVQWNTVVDPTNSLGANNSGYVTLEIFSFEQDPASNLFVQVWHNGTSNYTIGNPTPSIQLQLTVVTFS